MFNIFLLPLLLSESKWFPFRSQIALFTRHEESSEAWAEWKAKDEITIDSKKIEHDEEEFINSSERCEHAFDLYSAFSSTFMIFRALLPLILLLYGCISHERAQSASMKKKLQMKRKENKFKFSSRRSEELFFSARSNANFIQFIQFIFGKFNLSENFSPALSSVKTRWRQNLKREQAAEGKLRFDGLRC